MPPSGKGAATAAAATTTSSSDANNGAMSAREVYERTGDASAALRLLQTSTHGGEKEMETMSPLEAYNECLLKAMIRKKLPQQQQQQQQPLEWWNELPALEASILQGSSGGSGSGSVSNITPTSFHSSARKRRRQEEEWTLTYNRSLLWLTQGQAELAAATLWKVLSPYIVVMGPGSTTATPIDKNSKLWQEILPVACRMGLLVLECIFTLSVGNPCGIPSRWKWKNPTAVGEGATEANANGGLLPVLEVESFLNWISKQIDTLNNDSNSNTSDKHSLKFTLHLYMARREFLERSPTDGKLMEPRIRSARKDLKQAMELFQQKLKQSSGDTGSIASSSVVSGAGNSTITNSNNINTTTTTTTTTPNDPSLSMSMPLILQRQNQAALSLKANTEQLKGNIKKSLILCSEAQAALITEDGNDDEGDEGTPRREPNGNAKSYYDAIHYNNLAVAYETHGKTHLALHSWSKAVACAIATANGSDSRNATTTSLMERDGTARLDMTCQILWNAALGSLQARNFMAAYECLGTCLELSSSPSQQQEQSSWRRSSKAWLRLGEACIGLWAMMQQHQQQERQGRGNSVSSFSTIRIEGEPKGIILEPAKMEDPPDIGELAAVLASPEDLEQLQINPLPRGRLALEHAMELMSQDRQDDDKTYDTVMAYMSAQLSLAYICLETKDYKAALDYAKQVLEYQPANNASPPYDMDSARKAFLERQQATARMYASEASCILGDAISSMKYLVGDGKNDAFDRLASALGGVTIETAASHSGSEGKMRLAKAQAMVRCSASTASACMGNLVAAKQLAMSAQAMSREGSYATKALIYCMLREGNRGAALTLLRSAR